VRRGGKGKAPPDKRGQFGVDLEGAEGGGGEAVAGEGEGDGSVWKISVSSLYLFIH